MPVTITINGESASETLHELRGLSGGLCSPPTMAGVIAGAGAMLKGEQGDTAEPNGQEAEKPASGRGRGRPRAAINTAVEPAPTPPATPQNISTGAERSNPESAQDQTEAQNAAATAPTAEPEKAKPMTLDDVRNAAKSYIDKFGMEAAQKDLQDALEDAVGGGIRAISKLDGANQEQLGKAVQAFVNAATAANRYARPTASALG